MLSVEYIARLKHIVLSTSEYLRGTKSTGGIDKLMIYYAIPVCVGWQTDGQTDT